MKKLYSNHQVRLEEGEVSHEISIIFLSQKISVILDFSLDCSGKGLSVSCITGTDELQKLSYFSLFKFKLVCHLSRPRTAKKGLRFENAFVKELGILAIILATAVSNMYC